MYDPRLMRYFLKVASHAGGRGAEVAMALAPLRERNAAPTPFPLGFNTGQNSKLHTFLSGSRLHNPVTNRQKNDTILKFYLVATP
jgi:hypothetical protein